MSLLDIAEVILDGIIQISNNVLIQKIFTKEYETIIEKLSLSTQTFVFLFAQGFILNTLRNSIITDSINSTTRKVSCILHKQNI